MMQLSPTEFIERLSQNTLQAPIVVTGMAKQQEAAAASFLFSPELSCDNWISIPMSVASSVEVVGQHSCGDHSHPLVRVEFNHSKTDDPVTNMLWALLQSSLSRSTQLPFEDDRPRRCPTGWWICEADAKCKESGAWGHGEGRARSGRQAFEDAWTNAMWNAGCDPAWNRWSELRYVRPHPEYEPC